MNTKKHYRLLKDLPNASKGVDFFWDEEEKMYRSVGTDIYGRHTYFDENVIQGNLGGWFKEVIEEKPPLGIMPEYIWQEQRKIDLDAAIKRYSDAKLAVPIQWIAESYSIGHWIENRKPSEQKELTKERLQKTFVAPTYFSDHPMCKKEEKVPSPQKDYDILTQTYNMDTLKVVIYSVRRLSDNTIWAVWEETQHGIIKNIEKEDDENPIIFYVGETNYPLFISELKKL